MELPTDIPTIMQNAGKYFMTKGNEIPEYQRNRLVEVFGPGTSPVDFIVRLAESLYAVADELDDEGRVLAAQAANLAAMNGWHEMSNRGAMMVNALRRRNGETTSQPVEDDPEPLESELETVEEPEDYGPSQVEVLAAQREADTENQKE
jgi:hypothetical protein